MMTLCRTLYLPLCVILCAVFDVRADDLLTVYDRMAEDSPALRGARYHEMAARQGISTAKRGYRPTAVVHYNELWVEQNVEQTEIEALRQGRETFQNRRALVEVEQPLFDATIGPRIHAAEARHRHRQFVASHTTDQVGRSAVENYLAAARVNSLLRSVQRVITRLESEQDVVTRMLERKVATLEDAQIVKRNLVAMQRERDALTHQLVMALSRIGLGEVPAGWGVLKDDADWSTLDGADQQMKDDPELSELRMEVAELEHRISAARRSGLPRFSLVGRYEYDDADNSVFGGAREIYGYEVGVALKWDLYQGGVVRSEMKEMLYEKLAREAELEAMQQDYQQVLAGERMALEQADRNRAHSDALLDYQKSIMEAAQRGYEAGTQTYINTLEAFMLYESLLREREEDRFAQLILRARRYADRHGWTRDLAARVNACFEGD